jgi:hypothetical protein
LLIIMKLLAAVLGLTASFAATAVAHDYSYANRPQVIFPPGRGSIVHVSPFPMSSRALAEWKSDACWRDCSSQAAWRFERCIGVYGADACRAAMDADDRACLRACRSRGGPYLNITD